MIYSLARYWKFRRNYDFMVHECQAEWGRADFIVGNGKHIIEIECKKSMSDFYADFKKDKHSRIDFYTTEFNKSVPNKFFFCVLPEMKETVLKYLEKYPKYGLLVCENSNGRNFVWGIEKSAKILHKEYPENLKKEAFRRMTNILIDYYEVRND